MMRGCIQFMFQIRIMTTIFEHKEGMDPAEINLIEMNDEQIGSYQDSVYLFDESSEEANVQLTLGDAFEYATDGNGMVSSSDATVYFRKGINNRLGEIVWQGVADSSGYLTLTVEPGIYTIEVNASEHETMFFTL